MRGNGTSISIAIINITICILSRARNLIFEVIRSLDSWEKFGYRSIGLRSVFSQADCLVIDVAKGLLMVFAFMHFLGLDPAGIQS